MSKKLTDMEARSVMLAAELEPLDPYRDSSSPWRCRCLKCSRYVFPRYTSIKQGQGGCAYCAGNKVHEKDVLQVMAGAGLRPQESYPGAHSKWACRCTKCDRDVFPRYGDVRRGSGGCPYCAAFARAKKLRTPQSIAVAVMQSAGLRPLAPFPNNNKSPWHCRCLKCGKDVSPSYGDVKRRKRGCGYCSKRFLDPSDAIQLMHSAGLKPLGPYPGNGVPWPSRCTKCGATVAPTYNNIQRGQGGCGYCAPIGFNLSTNAFIYLVYHRELNAIKIGIGAAHRRRAKQHAKYGWDLWYEFDGFNGAVAYKVESIVLHSWRQAGIPEACSSADMPQGGWTETAPLARVNLAQTRRLIEKEIRRALKEYDA